jgi:hypothetical protein
MGAAENGASVNITRIAFDVATGSGWGTIVALVFFNAATGGTPIAFSALSEPISVMDGQIPVITPGNLTISAQ